VGKENILFFSSYRRWYIHSTYWFCNNRTWFPKLQQQHVMPLNVVALSASTTGANSRRGSNCSSIYRNNTNQNTYRPVPMVHRNSKGVDQSVTRSNSQTTSFTMTDNSHPNSRNSQQATNNNEKQHEEPQSNSTTNNHTSTTSPAVEDTNTDPNTACMPVIYR
jgi:hypothetical protein